MLRSRRRRRLANWITPRVERELLTFRLALVDIERRLERVASFYGESIAENERGPSGSRSRLKGTPMLPFLDRRPSGPLNVARS